MGDGTEGYGYTCRGGRQENEDSYGIFSRGENFCAAVADGLGGHGDGGRASKIAVRHLLNCGAKSDFPVKEDIQAHFTAANEEIINSRTDRNRMKTTAVWLGIWGGQAIWAHIGDSRLYHFVDETLCDCTLDHSVSQMAVALGEIRREEIPGHCDRSRLLRVLGDEELSPEIHNPVDLKPGRHAFLLCTDGFWESITEDEMLLDLYKSKSPREWIYAMSFRVLKRQGAGHDNHTAVGIFAER